MTAVTAKEKILQYALEELNSNPDGLSYSNLRKSIVKRDGTLNKNTIGGVIHNLQERLDNLVYKTQDNRFRLIKYRDTDPSQNTPKPPDTPKYFKHHSIDTPSKGSRLPTADKLKFHDVDFAISHLIVDCPPQTVVRELIMNAVEAVTQYTPPGEIECFSEEVDGVPKIGFYNEGGMTAEELNQYMDLASSGKGIGLDDDGHYGQGGKVSGLAASPHGLIYRSCKNGSVSQVTLRMTHLDRPFPIADKQRYPVEGRPGSYASIIDVTDDYRNREDRSLEKDWTEVVLLGKSQEHNTLEGLFPGDGKYWLMRLINTRFLKLPEGVVIRRPNITSREKYGAHAARGLEVLMERWSDRTEDAITSHPSYGTVTIRYMLLREKRKLESRESALTQYGIGRGDHICLTKGTECYEFHQAWAPIAGRYGMLFGATNIAVHVNLPSDAPVTTSTHRDMLLRKSDRKPVRIEEFADLVRDNIPPWLEEYIGSQHKTTDDTALVNEALRRIMEELQALGEPEHQVDKNGGIPGSKPTCPELPGTRNEGTGRGGKPRTAKPAVGQIQNDGTGIPKVEFANDLGILEAINGRAACYRQADHTVFLNPTWWCYERELQKLCTAFQVDTEQRQEVVQGIYDREYKIFAGRWVVQAWLQKGRAEWTDADWTHALAEGAFTVHLLYPEAYRSAYPKIKRVLGKQSK